MKRVSIAWKACGMEKPEHRWLKIYDAAGRHELRKVSRGYYLRGKACTAAGSGDKSPLRDTGFDYHMGNEK
jgi:hypothetical protein